MAKDPQLLVTGRDQNLGPKGVLDDATLFFSMLPSGLLLMEMAMEDDADDDDNDDDPAQASMRAGVLSSG